MTRFPGEQGARLCRECESILVPGEGPLCLGCADGGPEAYGQEPEPPYDGSVEPLPPNPWVPNWVRSGRHG